MSRVDFTLSDGQECQICADGTLATHQAVLILERRE